MRIYKSSIVASSRYSVLARFGPRHSVPLTKRELGVAYFFAVSVSFTAIFVAVVALGNQRFSPWNVFCVFAVGSLVAITYWLRQLAFGREQVWTTAKFGALGTATVTVSILGTHFTADILTVSHTQTIALITVIALSTVVGALAGIAIESQRTARRLSIRNSVLDRVLRHNLRNDLSVVLANVETAKATVDEPEREQLDQAERKINALVTLVDSIRQANTTIEPRDTTPSPLDLVSLLECRIERLRRTYPNVDLRTAFPDQAWVHAEQQFALVVDNVVQSASMYSAGDTRLDIGVTVSGSTVALRIDDVEGTIPADDLSALVAGEEEALAHGRGVELWLLTWLTERSGGTVSIDSDGQNRSITISLPRARPVSTDDTSRP